MLNDKFYQKLARIKRQKMRYNLPHFLLVTESLKRQERARD